jgi:hypothetical protein
MAQLVARVVWDDEVLGSSPSTPTESYPKWNWVMPTCRVCGNSFPNKVTINGVKKNCLQPDVFTIMSEHLNS